jgi:NAD(P)-dependent dehydrogenase (short-subunit alcohol dehydrogenase family)
MPMNPRLQDWSGRTAWLLGASSGIGLALARRLHALGARVIVSARSPDALQAFAQQHPGSLALPLDVTDRAATAAAAAEVRRQHAQLDLVLHCVGTYQPLRATEFDLDVMLKHQQVNYVGALHVVDAVLPQLMAQASSGGNGRGGHLSLVASVAGYRALPNALAYGPTKAALIHLAQSLHLDLAPLGLGVSVINPGFVDTPLTAQNHFHMPALMTPDAAASAILQGWARGDFELHFPRRFTLWLKALQWAPDGLYERLIRRATGL